MPLINLLCTLASVAGLQNVKESFLPFWAVATKVKVHLRGARLGYTTYIYTPATKCAISCMLMRDRCDC